MAANQRASNFGGSRFEYPNGRGISHVLAARGRIFVYRVRSRTKMAVSGRAKKAARTVAARSEVESDLARNGSGCDVVGSAKGREEIVKRDFIGHVDDG